MAELGKISEWEEVMGRKCAQIKREKDEKKGEVRDVADEFLRSPGLLYKWSGAEVFVGLLWFFSQ